MGDYVSDEVTKFRGERFRIERQIVAMRKDLEARTTLGRFEEAKVLKKSIADAESRRDGITRAIEAEQTRLLRRYDEEL